MEDLIKFQTEQIEALKKRNEYLEKELKQARSIFQQFIDEWEVINAETVK